MSVVYRNNRLTQSAHVPMQMVEVMPEEDMPAFILELLSGAWTVDKMNAALEAIGHA